MNYDWGCQACESTVKAGNNTCTTCGCPASCTGREVDEFKAKYLNSDAARAASKFRCEKCDHHQFNTGSFRASGGGLSAVFDVATENFNYISCNQCGFTDFYKSKIGGGAFIADVLLSN